MKKQEFKEKMRALLDAENVSLGATRRIEDLMAKLE